MGTNKLLADWQGKPIIRRTVEAALASRAIGTRGAIAAGSRGASGPLLAATGDFPFGDELFLIDILKMRRYDNTAIPNPGVHPDVAMKMWASHDGRAFTATSGGLSKPSAYVLRTNGWGVNPSPCNPPFLGANGETVFGGGSIASISGQPVGEKRGERGKGVWYLPASQGPFFLSLNERTLGQWPNEKKWPELQVHIGRDQRPIVALPELPELRDFVDFFFAKPSRWISTSSSCRSRTLWRFCRWAGIAFTYGPST